MQSLEIKNRHFGDECGALVFGEIGHELSFTPARFFVVYDVPVNELRGEHAHKKCEQFLIATNGNIDVILKDGMHEYKFELRSPQQGLYIPAGIWGEQIYLSEGASLMVLASHVYDADDYIRDYPAFLEYRKNIA